jgi:SAM-dependent methyltransferase
MLTELPATTDEVACVEAPAAADQVDEAGYLAANPDVRATGLSARDHFTAVGQAQGRIQAINIDQVTRLRAGKLARVVFRGASGATDRAVGCPANFLSAELLQEFAVPEAPPVSAHPYPDTVVRLIRDNPDKLFLDVGAGLRPTYYGNVVNTEIYPSFSTDVLCVGEAMPFASDQFDFVFCFATLEHTKRPWDVAAEICRVLKPGGTVMIDYPFMQPVHGYPHHYFNATPMGNRSLFERDCEIQSVDIGWHHHPMIGLQWMLTVFHRGLPPSDAEAFGNLRIKDIVDKPLDDLLQAPYCINLHTEMQRVIASGSLLIGTKNAGIGKPWTR